MAGYLGADPDELRSLAGTFGAAGARLDATASEVGAAFGRTTWRGWDAERFGDDWQTRIGPVLRSAAETLREQGELLRAEALQQEQASSADGGGRSSDGGGGGKASAEAPVDQGANDEALAEHAEQGDPEATAEWWQSLSEDEQDRLANDFPDLVGDLEGADYDDRHTANEIRLDRDLAAAEEAGRDREVEQLQAIRDALGDGTGVPTQLISYTPAVWLESTTRYGWPIEYQSDRPLAAISVGDLDTASNATWIVPGMNTVVEGMPGQVGVASSMREEQLLWQQEFGGPPGDIAVVAWVGYETPGLDTVGTSERAEIGGDLLAQALLGYDARTETAGLDHRLTVNGHSYGSTTAAYALQGLAGGVVDTFVTAGSAGIDGDIADVGELSVPEGEVYSLQADEQPGLAAIGRFISGREDPRSDDFGAVNVSSLTEQYGGQTYEGGNIHDMNDGVGNDGYGYYERGTTSMRNMAWISLGYGDEATRG